MEIVSITAIVFILFIMPMAFMMLSRKHSRNTEFLAAFLTNKGGNGIVATLAGAVCGNIGIGSFIAIFLFTSQSPIIGFSIVGAYTLGLLLCGLLAYLIRSRADNLGAVGLIDLIALSHGTSNRTGIWFPIAIVFVIRSAVQLGALGILAAEVFGGSQTLMTIVMASLITLYLVVGGYKAAVETDIIQSLIIIFVMALAMLNLSSLQGQPTPFFNLDPYRPAILIGIWLFIPWSAVLAVDNWQRITVARSTKVAAFSYFTAALICGSIFLTTAIVGYYSDGTSVYKAFEALMPTGFFWLANAMFIACIMSSIDTFIMPLTSAIGKSWSLTQLRLFVVFLVFVTTCAAILFGDLLTNIIAAFNSLVVFLPATFGALFLKKANIKAAISSMTVALLATFGYTFFDMNMAALVGFICSTVIYIFVTIATSRAIKNDTTVKTTTV